MLALVLVPRGTTPPEVERPAVAGGLEAPDVSRGFVVFDGCSLVDDAGVAPEDRMPARVMSLLPAGLDWKNVGGGGQTTVRRPPTRLKGSTR